ncbi:hypothetical protein [Caudoviricetes sp.]|nr:hypothetical protein [Caudoviricetes sp.]
MRRPTRLMRTSPTLPRRNPRPPSQRHPRRKHPRT